MSKQKLIWVVLAAIALSLSVSSVTFAQSSERVVKAQGYVSTDAVRAGDKFKVAVTVRN